MRRARWLIVIVVLAAVALLASGCGQGSKRSAHVLDARLAVPCRNGCVFVSETGAGSRTGEDGCSEAHPVSWMNDAVNWGPGSGGIEEGSTVALCGAFSGPVEVRGSGLPGKPVTVLFTSGAKIAMSGSGCPSSGCLNVAGNSEYVTIDGGGVGVIENTARAGGKSQGEQEAPTTAIKANGCKHCVIESLEIADLQIAKQGETIGNTEIKGVEIREGTPEYITIKNDVFHDMGWAINIEVEPKSTNILVENNTFTHLTHAFALSATFNGGEVGPVTFAHNHMTGNLNWQDAALTNHVDVMHCFSGGGKGYTPHYTGIYIYDNYGTLEGTNINTPIFIEGGHGEGSTPCANSTSPIWVFNNVLHTTYEVGNGVLGVTSGEPHVFNNTVIGSETSEGICLHFNSVAANAQLKNNLSTTCQVLFEAETARFASGGIDYNLYANGGNNRAWVCNGAEYAAGTSGLTKWQSCTSQDTHAKYATEAKINLNETPGLFGKPETGSPALGAGTNLTNECNQHPPYTTELCQNITGETRPTTGNWNTGAY